MNNLNIHRYVVVNRLCLDSDINSLWEAANTLGTRDLRWLITYPEDLGELIDIYVSPLLVFPRRRGALSFTVEGAFNRTDCSTCSISTTPEFHIPFVKRIIESFT